MWIHQNQIIPEDGDAEDEGVDAVEDATVSRKEAARILDAGRTLAGGFEQVAHLASNVSEECHREEMGQRDGKPKMEGASDDERSEEAAD